VIYDGAAAVRGSVAGSSGILAGMRFALGLAIGGLLFAQTPVRRIRQNVVESLNRTPSFLCHESVERSQRTAGADWVKLPVFELEAGVINGEEMYAPPQAYDDRARLRELLALFSTAGTGSFALYSRGLFLTTNASYYGLVTENKDGVQLARTDFAMPQSTSTYSLAAGGKRVVLGYSGSLWLEPDTLALAGLALRADDPPKDAEVASVTQSFHFAPVKLGSSTVRLPVSMELQVQERSGRQQHLAAHFSACREYVSQHGEQMVEAAEPAEPLEPPANAAAEGAWLPAGLELRTVADDAIDERSIAQGSHLTFTVTHEVKVKGKVLVAKGAVIEGHVTRLLRQAYPLTVSSGDRSYYLVGIHLDTVISGSQRFQLSANLENLGPEPVQRTSITESTTFVPYSSDPNRWGTLDTLRPLFKVPRADPGESFVGVVDVVLRMPRHQVMYWSTQEPS